MRCLKLGIAICAMSLGLVGCAPFDAASGPYNSFDDNFGQATSFNYAQNINRLERLELPADLGNVNSQAAVGPIERYQTGSVRELDLDLGSTSGSSGGGS